MAYENGSVFMSGPLKQWPILMHTQFSGPCATSDNAWHNEHHQKAAHAPAEDHESKSSQRHNAAHHPQHEQCKECICAMCLGTPDFLSLPCSIGSKWQPILKWKSNLSFVMDMGNSGYGSPETLSGLANQRKYVQSLA